MRQARPAVKEDRSSVQASPRSRTRRVRSTADVDPPRPRAGYTALNPPPADETSHPPRRGTHTSHRRGRLPSHEPETGLGRLIRDDEDGRTHDDLQRLSAYLAVAFMGCVLVDAARDPGRGVGSARSIALTSSAGFTRGRRPASAVWDWHLALLVGVVAVASAGGYFRDGWAEHWRDGARATIPSDRPGRDHSSWLGLGVVRRHPGDADPGSSCSARPRP